MPDNEHCPSCGHDQIQGGSLDWEGTTIRQRMHCVACDWTWIDCYEFSGRRDDR